MLIIKPFDKILDKGIDTDNDMSGRGGMKRKTGAGRTKKAHKSRQRTASAPLPPKLTLPRPLNIFPRKRLFHLLDRIREDHPVIWISAPAGSGKTSLTTSYLQARKLPVLWYQVDAGDGDIASFFYYMGIAVKKAAPRYKQPMPLLTPEYLGDIPTFTRNFFREVFRRLPKGMAIVLDNYQDVPEDSQLHDIMQIAMAEVPEEINLLVLSRNEPPSVLARLRLCEHAACLDWEKMRLTAEETIGISSVRMGRKSPDSKALTALHESVQGWAAGVVLMLEQSRGGAPLGFDLPTTNQKLLFDYFAGEILNRCEPKVREFLLKTALFPKVSAEAARELTGITESQAILDDLTRRNYFTVRHAEETEDTFEYHPLFREFLLKEAEGRYSAEDLKGLCQRAAALLSGFGHLDEAADLSIKINNWELLVQLILQHASIQLAHGRWQTLIKWISALPAEYIDSNPWLLFFRGSAIMPRDLFTAREDFHQAYLEFKKRNDPVGIYTTWSCAVDTFSYLWIDFKPLDYWIEEMEEIERCFLEYPSLEIEARVTCGMIGAALWRKADTELIQSWANRAEAILLKTFNPSVKIMIGFYLLLYHFWWRGNVAKTNITMQILQPIGADPNTTMLARIMWQVIDASYHYLENRPKSAVKAAHIGLNMAQEFGVYHVNLLLHAQAVYGYLTEFNTKGAQEELRHMESLLSDAKTFDFAHYHYLMVWELLNEYDFARALEHAKKAVQAADEIDASCYPPFARLTYAQVLYESGMASEAFSLLKEVREWGLRVGNSYIEAHFLFMEAICSLDANNLEECTVFLDTALALCERQGFTMLPWFGWRKPLLTRMLSFAIAHEIKTDYARHVVSQRNLLPPDNEPVPDLWPFPVKLYTLGRFSLLVDDKPIKYSGKGQKKPIELLKALIAFGGRDVLEGQLTDLLWPDAEGDAGHSAFTTTMQRLRKILCNEDAILIKEGKITLNPQYCYADTWAFERLIIKADEMWKENKESEALGIAEKALALYKGQFLGKEGEGQGMLSMQERLRSKFIRTLTKIGGYLEKKGEWKKAVECYQKGIEVDNLCEEFYQSLMLCCQHLGLKAEAITAYKSCCNAMTANLNTEPSAKTKEIYQRIAD